MGRVQGLICRVWTPPGPLHFDPGWAKVSLKLSVSIDIRGGGIFEKIKPSYVGSNIVAAFGYFCITLFDFQNCQSRHCLCLLEPINTLQRQYTENSKQKYSQN